MLFFYQLLNGGLSEEIETSRALNTRQRITMTQSHPCLFRIRLTIHLILRYRHLRDVWLIPASSSNSSAYIKSIVHIGE